MTPLQTLTVARSLERAVSSPLRSASFPARPFEEQEIIFIYQIFHMQNISKNIQKMYFL